MTGELDALQKHYSQIQVHLNLRCLITPIEGLQDRYRSNFAGMQMQRMKFGRRIGAPEKENKKEWVPCEKPPKKILVMPKDRSSMLRNLTNVRKTLTSERSTPADGAKKEEKTEEKK